MIVMRPPSLSVFPCFPEAHAKVNQHSMLVIFCFINT